MIEILTGLASTVTFFAGLGVGAWMGRTRQPKPPPEPICGCRHPLALHDPATNRCHAIDRKEGAPVRYYANGAPSAYGYTDEPCQCRQYSGPKPVDQFFAHKMIMPGDDT
jgi:hypothetical protein